MGTDKRERQKAGRQARIEAARIAQEKAEQRGKVLRLGSLGLFVVIVVVGFWYFRRDTGQQVASSADPTTSATPASADPNKVTIPTVPDAEKISGDTPCPPAGGADKRVSSFEKAPPMCIDPAKMYMATVSTSRGDFTVMLDAKAAPKTVNNFVTLARYKFYDGIGFHRIVTDFAAQVGDPTASGSGGPGYKFDDELPKDTSAYKLGTLAMANSGANTNGSQFFIVLKDGAFPKAAYSVFGQVTTGLDTVVKEIAGTGSAGNAGTPTAVTTIKTITVTQS
jgi:cyclophilin family peptidyl-prolyl cis-trans isomerase